MLLQKQIMYFWEIYVKKDKKSALEKKNVAQSNLQNKKL